MLLLPGKVIARRHSESTVPQKTKDSHLKTLTGENRDLYQSLSPEQKEDLRKGKIKVGYNTWMVQMALGEPFFRTVQNGPKHRQEDVWLYTKTLEDNKVTENKFMDSRTGSLSLRRVTQTKSCVVGDFFVVFDRSVVIKISPEDSKKNYGPCKTSNTEEIIPFINKR